jgi:hypothetical protein
MEGAVSDMNNKPEKLARVDLREIWKNEEYDFSNWLAEKDSRQPQRATQILKTRRDPSLRSG